MAGSDPAQGPFGLAMSHGLTGPFEYKTRLKAYQAKSNTTRDPHTCPRVLVATFLGLCFIISPILLRNGFNGP